MRMVHVRGIEIIDDASVPDGEIWIMCPMQNGGKVRYMFNLHDHRMTQPGAEKSFFLQLEDWLTQLGLDLQSQATVEDDLSLTRLELILAAMRDFKEGKDTRTIPDEG